MWMWSNRVHFQRDENEIKCDVNKSCDLYYEKDISSYCYICNLICVLFLIRLKRNFLFLTPKFPPA